jgi:hypothetical protein
MSKRNKNAYLNFLELKIGGSLYEVYLHKPTIIATMADVTTHTHVNSKIYTCDLSLLFDLCFSYVIYICDSFTIGM